jgi:hypothetical protein
MSIETGTKDSGIPAQHRYEPGTLFTEFRRDMVYRLRYRWEVHVYALEGDMSDETESSNDR